MLSIIVVLTANVKGLFSKYLINVKAATVFTKLNYYSIQIKNKTTFLMDVEQLLSQGAEGRLYISEYKGEKCLIKERFVKKYRHPDLDSQITKQRIKAENNASTRCLSAGVLAPKILHVDQNARKIYMQYFDKAITSKEYINKIVSSQPEEDAMRKLNVWCSEVGSIVGKLHANNIIHGDLTTSNLLVDPKKDDFSEYQLVVVDFGLSHYDQSTEDKGVDLYVLERALLSTHSQQPELFENILQSYRKEYAKDEKAVLSKFEQVRARGRKRTMIG